MKFFKTFSSFIFINYILDSLIGDTNLFLVQEDNSGDGETNETVIAEAEIMIAEERVRGKRFGWESMLLMLKYGQTNLKCTKFIVKIGFSNLKSINMFTNMQFYEVRRSAVFEEITFERPCSAEWTSWLDKQIDFRLEKYP